MKTNIITNFTRNGSLPIMQIMATLFFIVVIVLSIKNLFDRKQGSREKYIKSLMIILIAGFIVLCAGSIANKIYSSIEGYTITDNYNNNNNNSEIDKFDGEMSWGVTIIIGLFDLLANCAIWLRNSIIGQNSNIREILNDNHTLVSLNVNYGNTTVNLYNIILTTASFLLFLMVLNSAYKLAKSTYDDREDAINSFGKWFKVILIMMIIPATMVTGLRVFNEVMSILNYINADCVLNTGDLTIDTYGPAAPLAKIYMAYIEFKVYVIMIYRKFIINAFFMTLPIPVYLWGISDGFESLKTWISTLLVNIFSPIFYTLSIVLGTIILKSMPNGNNPINVIIILTLSLKVGDGLKEVVKWKCNSKILGGSSEVSGIARTVFAVTMLARTIKKLLSKKGKSVIGMASKVRDRFAEARGTTYNPTGANSNNFTNRINFNTNRENNSFRR